MAAKPVFRVRPSTAAARAFGASLLRGRAAIVGIALALGCLAFANPSLADTGSVYVDSAHNVGAGANFFNDSFRGGSNIGLGNPVMPSLTTGGGNIAIGDDALFHNTRGILNVASGGAALNSNTKGNSNIATGASALAANTTGDGNIATGSLALASNSTGNENIASGLNALFNNNGNRNIATGFQALSSNTTGHDNVAYGYDALDFNTTGRGNVAVGSLALLSSTGSRNVALGSGAGQALITGSNNVDIANAGTGGESATIRIGTDGVQRRAFLAGIRGVPVHGVPVLIAPNGKLGTAAPASAKASAARPLSAGAGKRLLATVKRLKRQNERQGKEIRALRAQRG